MLFLIWADMVSLLQLMALLIAGIFLSVWCRFSRVPLISYLLDIFEKEEHLKVFPGRGALMFLFGTILAIIIFPKDIALASIAVLTFGDSVSALYGIAFGRVQHPLSRKKFAEGNIAGGAAAFIVALLFVSVPEALFASIVGMLIEAVESRRFKVILDDNLTIPMAAGLVILLIRILF
ncbi:hypothetical protein JW968_00835 [Candidatus Woesearchaeota archaeon]|nr:hypothetical protein [Candidatus Woesearchaeota archaeon]